MSVKKTLTLALIPDEDDGTSQVRKIFFSDIVAYFSASNIVLSSLLLVMIMISINCAPAKKYRSKNNDTFHL